MYRSLFMLVALTLAVTGCCQSYRFTGMVVDGDGEPITDASVSVWPLAFESEKYTTQSQNVSQSKTGGAGAFKMVWQCAPGVDFFRMNVKADGFNEDFRIVEANAYDLRIVLERITVPDPHLPHRSQGTLSQLPIER